MVRLLVVYDVSDNGKRSRLAKELKRFGLSRIQRSAFAGEVDQQRFKDLCRACSTLVDEDTDVVHVIQLGLRDWERRVVIGVEGGGEDDRGFVV